MQETMNVVVLVGTLIRAPGLRNLPSGSVLAQLEVRVPGPAGRAEAVPVAWFDPPGGLAGLEAGSSVVVTGRVRRRFFSAGGVTGSRTEVVAERVVPLAQGRRARAALARARDALARSPAG
jgi:single-strand DNA-binding protein